MMEICDNYEHVDPKLTYIVENMKTQEIENSLNYEFLGCDCENECSPAGTCSCLERSGANYIYPNVSDLKNYIINIKNEKPIYECNNNCKCRETLCGNKLVLLGPRENLKIIDSGPKGLGLHSEESINVGNFICEYAGEIITQFEAHKRFKIYENMGLQHNYIFCINENFGAKNDKTFIDPTFYGNIGRYINHSCEANSILIPIRLENIPRLCIFASETINKNSEITFNYGQLGELNQNKKCFCLSKNCKRFLPYDVTI